MVNEALEESIRIYKNKIRVLKNSAFCRSLARSHQVRYITKGGIEKSMSFSSTECPLCKAHRGTYSLGCVSCVVYLSVNTLGCAETPWSKFFREPAADKSLIQLIEAEYKFLKSLRS